jgi:hypothetical protein
LNSYLKKNFKLNTDLPAVFIDAFYNPDNELENRYLAKKFCQALNLKGLKIVLCVSKSHLFL